MRSTNSSKLFIDFYPVGRDPGTSGGKTGFELEEREGRLSLGLAGKVRRQALGGLCLLGVSLPSLLEISGRRAGSSRSNMQMERGSEKTWEEKTLCPNAGFSKMTHILNILPYSVLRQTQMILPCAEAWESESNHSALTGHRSLVTCLPSFHVCGSSGFLGLAMSPQAPTHA